MARIYRIIAAFLMVMLLTACLPVFEQTALAESDGMIRVKITRLGSTNSITFKTSCDYFIDGDKAACIPSGSSVTVKVTGANLILISGTYSLNMGDDFTIKRQYAGVNGVKFTSPALSNVYCGDFRFMLESGNITTIMTIYVEDYLYGVVGYEMSNSYPLEALKAQAVAARNYVLRAKANRSKKAYDVVDTSTDQVFRGYNSSYTRVIKAVDETRGVVLGYDGKLAYCYYSASNGGQTESTKNAWGSKLAYSVVKEDRFDLEGSGKCNSVTLKKDQTGVSMNPQLHAAFAAGMKGKLTEYGLSTEAGDIQIETILSVEPRDPKYAEPSILYKTLRFTVVASSVDANGERVSATYTVDIPTYGGLEDWFGLSINSSSNETVSVDETETEFKISFRRWGHGIGMSQQGARIMALNYSMDYEDILGFYYNGTEVSRLNLSDTTGKGLTYSGDSSVLEEPLEPAATPEPEFTPEPLVTAAPESTQAPEPEAQPLMQAKVKLSSSSSSLNMRSGASTSTKVVTRLKNGTQVDVYAIEGDWVEIGVNGTRGYVMKKYLVKVNSEGAQPSVTPTPVPDNGSEPIMQAKVKLSSGSGKLNVRKGPSTSTAVVTRIKHGVQVDVYAIEGNWVAIGIGGVRGYVMKSYLVKVENSDADKPAPTNTPAPETTAAPGAEATVQPTAAPEATPEPTPRPEQNTNGEKVYAKVKISSGSKLKLRKGPGTSYKVLGYLQNGNRVEVTAVSGSWAKVITSSGSTGYVHKSYLVRVYEEDNSPAATPVPQDGNITAVAVESTFVYSQPDTSSPAVAGLDEGDTVIVTAYNNTWAKVMIDGNTGYVPVEHLKRAK